MPVLACVFPGVDAANSIPAKRVLARRDRLQMRRVHAFADTTEMIKLESSGNLAVDSLPRITKSRKPVSMIESEAPVSVFVAKGRYFRTGHINMFPVSFFNKF